MHRFSLLLVLSCLTAAPAAADRYWVAYEGNDFPENEGWTRGFGFGGADRTLAAGLLELDGLSSEDVFDYYERKASIAPAMGESFVVQWRVFVAEVHGGPDISLAINADDRYSAGFQLSDSAIRTVFGAQQSASFEPGRFHEFHLYSSDMRAFVLEIDGAVQMTGFFHQVASASRIAWGDGVQGASSLSQWDYVRFGIVPESDSATLMAGLLILMGLSARSFR